MAASRAQIIANRINALRSTGPRTDEGKARSRRNATTHGLSRLGVVAPEFMADAIADRRISWRDAYQPDDPTQEWFFDRLCAESVRVDFCDARIVSSRAELAERASESWDDDRALDAAKLGARLSKQPDIIQPTLLQSRHGVLWLLDRWDEVAHQICAIGGWTLTLWNQAMDLLGLPIAVRQHTGPWSLDDADNGPEPGLKLVREATDALRSRLTDTLNARDSRARLDAQLGLSADEPAPLRLLHRYAADARRQVFRNLNELIRLQRLDSGASAAASASPVLAPAEADAGPPGPRPDRSGRRALARTGDSPSASPRAQQEDSPPSSHKAEFNARLDALLAHIRPRPLTEPRASGPQTPAPNSPAEATSSTRPTPANLPVTSPAIASSSNPDRPSSSLSPNGSRPPGSSTTSSPSPASGPTTRPTPGVSKTSRSVVEPPATSARSPQTGPAMSPAQVVAARFSSSTSPKPSPAPESSPIAPAPRSTSTSPSPSPAARETRSTGLVASIQAKLSAERPLANRRSRRAQAAARRS